MEGKIFLVLVPLALVMLIGLQIWMIVDPCEKFRGLEDVEIPSYCE